MRWEHKTVDLDVSLSACLLAGICPTASAPCYGHPSGHRGSISTVFTASSPVWDSVVHAHRKDHLEIHTRLSGLGRVCEGAGWPYRAAHLVKFCLQRNFTGHSQNLASKNHHHVLGSWFSGHWCRWGLGERFSCSLAWVTQAAVRGQVGPHLEYKVFFSF